MTIEQQPADQGRGVGECEVCRIFGDSNLLRKSAASINSVDDEMVLRALDALSPEAVTNRYGYRKGYRIRDVLALDDYEATEVMRTALTAAIAALTQPKGGFGGTGIAKADIPTLSTLVSDALAAHGWSSGGDKIEFQEDVEAAVQNALAGLHHYTQADVSLPRQSEAVEREDDYIVPKSVYEEMLTALADSEAIGFISEESLAVLLDKDGYQKWVEICNTNSGEGKPRIPLYRVPTAHGANRIEVEVSGAGVLAVMDRAHMELLISDRFDEAAEIGLAREAISSLLCCSKSLAEVYDAMGSPRGPSRIMLDAALARCKGTPAQADTAPAAHGVGDAYIAGYKQGAADYTDRGINQAMVDDDARQNYVAFVQAASAPGGCDG